MAARRPAVFIAIGAVLFVMGIFLLVFAIQALTNPYPFPLPNQIYTCHEGGCGVPRVFGLPYALSGLAVEAAAIAILINTLTLRITTDNSSARMGSHTESS
jgi:hypothetical protein